MHCGYSGFLLLIFFSLFLHLIIDQLPFHTMHDIEPLWFIITIYMCMNDKWNNPLNKYVQEEDIPVDVLIYYFP